jgi:hypothetical protein
MMNWEVHGRFDAVTYVTVRVCFQNVLLGNKKAAKVLGQGIRFASRDPSPGLSE